MNNLPNRQKHSTPSNTSTRLVLEQQEAKKRERTLWGWLFLSIYIIGLAYFFIEIKDRAEEEQAVKKQTDSANISCDSSPPVDKSAKVLDPSAIRRSDVLYSGLELVNEFPYDAVLEIGSQDLQEKYMTVALYSGSKTTLSLPIGNYGLGLKVGHTWCNDEIGFSDGKLVNVDGLLHIASGSTQQLKVVSTGPGIESLHLAYNRIELNPPPSSRPQVDSHGLTEIHQDRGGSYFVTGRIGAAAINFQVDTGANITSIPAEIASSAGIYTCENRVFETANGKTVGCVGRVHFLSFGSFTIENVEVAVMPNLKGALLGMNVLSHVHIVQSEGTMWISLR